MINPWEAPNAWDVNDLNTRPDIREILERLASAQRQQQPQEQPNGQEMADGYFHAGLEQRKQEADAQAQAQRAQQIQDIAQQMPQQQRPMTPLDVLYQEQMLGYKNDWENSIGVARGLFPKETDASKIDAIAKSIQKNAHAGADKVREYAKAADVDLNGIENVGYEEAADNYAKRRAQELAELMNPKGKYAQTSAQYLDTAYLMAGGQGMSAREAQRFATRRAQQYQSDRVAYLRNAFDVYGVDGNYINSTGVEIINQLAQEMPSVANVYAQAYQFPTDAQTRQNELEDKEIEHANKLGEIEKTGKVNAGLQSVHDAWQSKENEKNRTHDIKKIKLGSDLRIREDELHIAAAFKDYCNKKGVDIENATQAQYAQFKTGLDIGENLFGLSGDRLKDFCFAFAGIKLTPNGTVASNDGKSVENLKKVYDTYNEAEKNILSQLKGAEGVMLDDKTRAQLENKLKEIRKHQAAIRTELEAAAKGNSQRDDSESRDTKFTGNWEHDRKIIEDFRKEAQSKGYTWEQIKQMVYKALIADGYTEQNARQAAGLD